MLSQVLTFVLFPAAAVAVGGVVAAFRPPGARLQSVFHHFAAGVVFAAVAGELLPELMHEAAPLPTVVGFALGVGLLLGIKRLLGREADDAPVADAPVADAPVADAPVAADRDDTRGLVVAVGVDLAVDGLLVGVGFAAGAEAGMLLTIALTLEVLFLGLATAAALGRAGASRGRIVGVTAAFAAILVAGAAAGGLAAGQLAGPLLAGVLAFAVAALLYLVTEELLVEAHETEDTPLATATFFAGFLALLLIEMAL